MLVIKVIEVLLFKNLHGFYSSGFVQQGNQRSPTKKRGLERRYAPALYYGFIHHGYIDIGRCCKVRRAIR